jgi:hypothetical protein
MHPFSVILRAFLAAEWGSDNGESKMAGSDHRKHEEKGKNEYEKELTSESADKDAEASDANQPRTTTSGWLTTPKFGSASSGGGEIEPGPERD